MYDGKQHSKWGLDTRTSCQLSAIALDAADKMANRQYNKRQPQTSEPYKLLRRKCVE